MEQSNIYREEVASLMMQILVKPEGAIIMSTQEHKMALGKDEVIVFTADGRESRKWEDISDEVLYDIYCFLDTAKKLHPDMVDDLVELDGADTKNWHIEPLDIIDTEDRTILGKLGVALESENENEKQLAVIYISPDGTWANLGMYRLGNTDEVQTAKKDLLNIANALMLFRDKL